MCVDSTYFPIFFPVKNTTGVEKTGIRRIPEGITNLALLLVIVTFFSHYWLSLPIVNAISPSICPHLFVDCCVKPFLHLLHCCCRCLLLWLRWGIWEGVKLPSLSLPCFPPPWQMQMIWGQIGVAPVKSPKIIFAQTPFNFSGCPRYICWWDRSQFLRKKKLPGSAPSGASTKNSAYFVSDWTGKSHLTHYLTGKTMGFWYIPNFQSVHIHYM
jgi:hypothetical protein